MHVCACVCVCVRCVCMHTHTHTCMHTHNTHTHIHTHTHTDKHTTQQARSNDKARNKRSLSLFLYMYACMYVRVHACVRGGGVCAPDDPERQWMDRGFADTATYLVPCLHADSCQRRWAPIHPSPPPRFHALSPARTSPGVTHGHTSRTRTQPFKRTLSRMPSAYNCVWSKNAR